MQAEVNSPRRRLPVASPVLALDDEHNRPTLEQRLDAAVLAAGATPPRGLKPTRHNKDLVPLRLDAPTTPDRVVDGVDRITPAPRMLQFLLDDDATIVAADDAGSRSPRREPVVDSSLRASFGVQTNVYRLDGAVSEELPNRPLPLVDDELVTVVGRPTTKVLTVGDHDVALASFSFDAEDDLDLTEEGGHISRAPHAAAAVALRALSDEGSGDLGNADAAADVEISDSYLDELARQLGLTGAVPRSGARLDSRDHSDSIDGVDLRVLASALDDSATYSQAGFSSRLGEHAENSDACCEAFASADDFDELVDAEDDDVVIPALKATDPMRVVRPIVRCAPVSAAAVDDDDDFVDEFADDEPSNTVRLPASLLSSFDEEAEVTPPHGSLRPSLFAPTAVQFVVASAPSRPRVAELSDEEIARNHQRAHDLYLVALDDIACKDTDSAIVHLQLALAYDDDTSLYGDLLAQLERKQPHRKRAS